MMSLRGKGLFKCGFIAASLLLSVFTVQAQGDTAVVYRCPGNLYTSTITAKEAREQGCRTLDGAPITVLAAPKRPAAASGNAPTASPRPDTRIDPSEQRARDSDARRILEAELQREEQRLSEMQAEYNKGEPERRGDERNYQKYLDRVSDLKSGIARKESDIAALKRELSKLP
ncbi:MAG: hypothetical protein V9G29_09245 [Burkholderiaceae bacterium]